MWHRCKLSLYKTVEEAFFNNGKFFSYFQFTIRGFNDKQVVLLEKLLDHLFDFSIDEKRFDILKEEYIRLLKNFNAEQPYQHSIYYLSLLLTENAWANVELLDAMERELLSAN